MLKRIALLISALVFVAAGQLSPAQATSFSNCYAYSQPTPGDPAVANSWGTILNTNMALIDAAGGGTLSLSVAGGANVTLTANNGSADQARNAHFVFTGLLTGNIIVLFPPAPRCGAFSVKNGTTGGFTLSVGVSNGGGGAAGTTIGVPQGGTAQLVSDGTNVAVGADAIGIGAASSGANSNITSLSGLTTPLTVGQGGTGNTTGAPTFSAIANGTMLANESGSSAAPTATTLPILHQQVFTSNGTFTVPAQATTATVFKFRCVGAGGGGGGVSDNNHNAGGGGSGGSQEALFSGFLAGQTATVNIGTGGTGGSGNGSGNTGGDTTLVFNAVTIMTCNGGVGGAVANLSPGLGGNSGAASSTAGASGLSLVSSNTLGSQAGEAAPSGGGLLSGSGGSNPFGTAGKSTASSGTGNNGSRGAGGSGSVSNGTGGSGGNGELIVEWVL